MKQPRGYFHIERSGAGRDLDLASSLEAKFGKVTSKKKNLESSKSKNSGVIFEIQRAKFGVLVTDIFWEAKFVALKRILEANFGAAKLFILSQLFHYVP